MELSENEKYIQSINKILDVSNVKSKKIDFYLSEIIAHYDEHLVDFKLLERGVRKVLLKKGNKKKNFESFFCNIWESLEKRKFDDDADDIDVDEPSILPKKIYRRELFLLQVELLKLQEWLKSTGKTVSIVFEGRDSAGKGSTIKKFIENMNPRYYNTIALGIPTEDERKFWWDRYRSKIHRAKINLFDRSWYNRGLVEPVMGYGTEQEYNDFMNNVNDFEKSLVNNGDYLFKLWFSIDKDTQKNRFSVRKKSPLKYWKYSVNDEKMQDKWEEFTKYKEKLFDQTSTPEHPWVILDSNDKKISGLNAIRYVLQNIPYGNKNEEILNREFPEAVLVLGPKN